MAKQNKMQISTYLCYLLRHAPEAVKLDMDSHGWVSVAQLIENVNALGKAHLAHRCCRAH